jgi:hypothetical protein
MNGQRAPYARTMSGVVATMAAVGAVGYFSARGISGPAPASTTASMSSALVAAAAGSNGADFGFSGSCGVERHDVKNLLDGFVPGAPQDSTVSALRAIPAPTSPTGRTADEKTVYRIQAVATAFKVEADSDVHLAIADPAAPNIATMIAEFPAASCLAGSTAAPQEEAARADMISALGNPSTGSSYRFLNPAPCVTLTGVAFFDRIHGQRGVAPNGIELHPVLAFQAGCGVPAPPPTSTATTPEEPPDTTPVTTAPLPTVSTPSVPPITTVPTIPIPTTTGTPPTPSSTKGHGCKRYPGRHWFKHVYHRRCKSYYFTTP